MHELSSNINTPVTLLDQVGLESLLIALPTIDQGIQARVGLIAVSDMPEPVLLKRAGVGKDLGQEEAQLLQMRFNPYKESLQNVGWQTPELVGTHLVRSESEWQIWSYEQYISGFPLSLILKMAGAKTLACAVVRDVIETLAGYNPDDLGEITAYGQTLTRLPHGIDLKPSNLVIADTGGTYMVDVFPPKELDVAGKLILHNPKLDQVSPETLIIACATRQGALLRLLRKTESDWLGDKTALRDDFIEDIDELLALSAMPADESEMIITEMDKGYPFLEKVYGDAKAK